MQLVRTDDDIVIVENCGYQFTIATPSRERTDVIPLNPLLPVANVFVAEDEFDTYAAYFADNEIAYGSLHAHTAKGLPAIRNVMLAACALEGTSWAYQSDDDFSGFKYMGRIHEFYLDLPRNLDVITSSGMVAVDIQAPVFGYAMSSRPQERNTLSPFDIRCRVNVDFGIVDYTLRFDEKCHTLSDADFVLGALSKHGFVWRDNRYFVEVTGKENGKLKGRLSYIRNSVTAEQHYQYLRNKWGSEIVRDRQKRGTQSGVLLSIPR